MNDEPAAAVVSLLLLQSHLGLGPDWNVFGFVRNMPIKPKSVIE